MKTHILTLTALLLTSVATLDAATALGADATSEVNPNKGLRTWAKAPVVANKVADICQPVGYAGQRLNPQSYLGRRVDINFTTGLLRTVDVDDYLRPYVKGETPKMPAGEYLGKFMQSYSRMYLYTGSSEALGRMEKIVRTMRKAQAADGWLGTAGRFVSWDVWEHKYVLLGFLEHYLLTGDPDALEGAKKVGDMMIANLGPDQGDLMQNGYWALGSGSILEPMVCLYRSTGEQKYLQFCEYILQAFEGGTGPKIVSTLTTGSKRVCDIEDPWANRAAREVKFGTVGQIRNRSKGYELLSCVIGIARMYQLTGKPEYLTAAKNCWTDISEKRLYLTGSSGADECFKDDHCLPGETADAPAEACVTAHWIFLSRILFEITGDPQYVDAIENALYNHLLASQRPQDCHQSYNTAINGTKTFERHTIWAGRPPCCISSTMREIARTPEAVWQKFTDNGLAVLLYNQGTMEDTIKTSNGGPVSVRLEMDSNYPKTGDATIRVRPKSAAAFRLALRVPKWAKDFKATVAGQTFAGTAGRFLDLNRTWQDGDTVKITMGLNDRLVSGGASYAGHYTVMHGPQVLTLVASSGSEGNLESATVKVNAGTQLSLSSGFLPAGWVGDQAYTTPVLMGATGCALVPFGDAGQPGKPGKFRTWIKADPGTTPAKPAAPSGLTASAASPSRINLAWTDNSGNEDGFRIERMRSDVGMWFHVKTATAGVTSCQDDAVNVVTPGKTYTYRVCAYNSGGYSDYAGEVKVTTPGVSAPAAPSRLTATAVSPSQINLSWAHNSDNEEGFKVERKAGADGMWTQVAGRVAANEKSFRNIGLESGKTYTYRIRASNTGGDSGYSSEANASTPAVGSKDHSTTKAKQR